LVLHLLDNPPSRRRRVRESALQSFLEMLKMTQSPSVKGYAFATSLPEGSVFVIKRDMAKLLF